MKTVPDHNSTPLSLDRFELERRLAKLALRPDFSERELEVVDEVQKIINRMSEEADAGISTYLEGQQ